MVPAYEGFHGMRAVKVGFVGVAYLFVYVLVCSNVCAFVCAFACAMACLFVLQCVI